MRSDSVEQELDAVRQFLARIEGGRGDYRETGWLLEEAMAFLARTGRHSGALRPDIILLDLNLPRKDGREVLAEIKQDESLRTIPVVVLTSSKAEKDIHMTYQLHANCFLTKPLELPEFTSMIQSFEQFWLSRVVLPSSNQL